MKNLKLYKLVNWYFFCDSIEIKLPPMDLELARAVSARLQNDDPHSVILVKEITQQCNTK